MDVNTCFENNTFSNSISLFSKIDDNLKSWRDTSKYREALWNQKIEKGLQRVLADQMKPVNVPEGRLKTLLNQR